MFVSYVTNGLMHFLQIFAHSKSDTNEVALKDYICLNALSRERLRVNKCCSTCLNYKIFSSLEGTN